MTTDKHKPLPGNEAEFTPIQRSAAETYLDKRGREIPDPLPMAPPIGYKRSPSLAEQIRAMVVSEKLRQEALESGFETFEESDDFEIEDDPADPRTPYEAVFDPAPTPVAAPPEKAARKAPKAQQSPIENPSGPSDDE